MYIKILTNWDKKKLYVMALTSKSTKNGSYFNSETVVSTVKHLCRLQNSCVDCKTVVWTVKQLCGLYNSCVDFKKVLWSVKLLCGL